MKFHVGFEIGSGSPVEAELHHLAIFGLTQKSGKTTALEAFIHRIDGNSAILVLRTGRGEIGFEGAHRIPFYFRERTDWQFVEGMISAHLQEKAKFYRGDIMRACRGARSLEDVGKHIQAALKKSKEGSFVEKIYTELDQYLSEILPQLRSVSFSSELVLSKGPQLMDLESVRPSMQQLVISATLDNVMQFHRDVIVVLPEARDFIPEDRRTPAKMSIENLIRKGAKLGNYLWCDSQSLTGLDLDIMRSVGIWMFGRQNLDREMERSAKAVPNGRARPSDIQSLKLGQFFLVQGEEVKKVYVQPAWLPEGEAISIAKGKGAAESAGRPVMEKSVTDGGLMAEFNALKEKNERLRSDNHALSSKITRLEAQIAHGHFPVPVSPDQLIPDEIDIEAKKVLVTIRDTQPEKRSFTTTNPAGRILFALIQDLCNKESSESEISAAMQERGWNYTHGTFGPELSKLVKAGTLIRAGEKPAKYRVPGKLVIEVKEERQ